MVETLAKVTIDEIFEYEERVYLDPSAKYDSDNSIRQKSSFGNHLYSSHVFENLNPDLIAVEYNEIKSFGRLLKRDKAATINSATMELRRFDRIVRFYLTIKKEPFSSRGKKNKSLLEGLVEEIKLVVDISKSKEVNTNSPQYKALKDMVKLIASGLSLKKDTYKKYGDKRGKSKQLDTDEEYVTLCLLDSLSGKRSSLLTADTDYINLFAVIPRVLGSQDYQPHNQFFCDSLAEFFPNLFYINREGGIELVDFDFVIDFIKYRRSGPISAKIKTELSKMWEEKAYLFNERK